MRFKKMSEDLLDAFPYLISANNCFDLGLSKYQFTKILNDPSAPVVTVGSKRYLKRDEFFKWLDENPANNRVLLLEDDLKHH